jgi:outer membrane protein
MKHVRYAALAALMAVALPGMGRTQMTVHSGAFELTLENAVDIAMGSSYRVKQLELGIDRTRYWLEARQASLKSSAYIRLRSPQFEAVSETKWNSTLHKDEIIRQNTRLWQMDLAINQPVVLFGRPTNGYLSLNNKVYRYNQVNGGQDISYYNRYYVKYEQPLFQPNRLKNNIEDAELDLERRELDYVEDRVQLIDDIADDYYDMFDLTYREGVYLKHQEVLAEISRIAASAAAMDTVRQVELFQAQVETANAREAILQTQSTHRRRSMQIKQRLRIPDSDSIYVVPDVVVRPIEVDAEQAVEYGLSLRPRLRMLGITRRSDEIDLENVKGSNSFHVDLEMTYGLEREDEYFDELGDTYDNSYSVGVNAYIPLWDWGRRKANIQAEEISIKKTDLYIEETRTSIRANILNAIINLEEYQERAISMRESVNMTRNITAISIENYRNGLLSLQDVLQVINQQRDTELNFLEAFLGYRRSLLWLNTQTYYDYENGISLIDKYRARM